MLDREDSGDDGMKERLIAVIGVPRPLICENAHVI